MKTAALALLLVGCGASQLPADHPCKAENAAPFIAECSMQVATACALSEDECVRQEQECNDELARRCR